jgi:hypothetical protein
MIQPKDGFCDEFKFNGIYFFRDSEDFLWEIKDKNPFQIVGKFNIYTEMIEDIEKDKYVYYDDEEY